MSSQKKARGLPGMKEGSLVQMLDRQRVQQAGADEAKKLVENLQLHFLIFVCVCACNREGTSHTSSRVDGRLE
jgi:hypothetical protein